MFKKMEYVYAVYQERNFTRAAEKLFISQPSLSAAIKGVEEEIGAPIFDRSDKELALTEIGKEYVAATEKMLQIQEEFIRKKNDIYGLETGNLSVGSSNHLTSYVVPPLVTKFRALYPKIEVAMTESRSVSLYELLDKGEVDLLIDNFDQIERYDGEPLLQERVFLCVPKTLAVNERLRAYALTPQEVCKGQRADKIPAVPIRAFADEQFVLLKQGNDMRARADRIFEKAGVTPNVAFEVDQLNVSYALADSGMGICFVTDTLFRFGKHRANVVLYNLETDNRRILYVAQRKNAYRSAAMQKFIQIAKEFFANEKP